MRVAIFAGHEWNGSDPGAIAKTGQTEAKTNHNVALKLEELLNKQGHKAAYLNKDGKDITIEQKHVMALNFKADVSIEVHFNDDAKKLGRGAETYAEHNDQKSKALADCIQFELAKLNENRGVKTAQSAKNPNKSRLGMLNIKGVICILVEPAFMGEVQEFDTLKEQWAIAEAMAEGVKKFDEKLVM